MDEDLQFPSPDPWSSLKQFTAARIAIGRTGISIPLKQSLELNLAHAHARDAVYAALEISKLTERLKLFNLPILHLHSEAVNRQQYLQRPDLGRKLNQTSHHHLKDFTGIKTDVAMIIADGLSATAVNHHTPKLLDLLIPQLQAAKFKLAPLCLVEQGRVAIADDIGFGLHAQLSIILIGERPGLSAADSMGAYLTYQPKPGLTDDSRNCISNIRPGGLSYKKAASKIFYLIQEAFKRHLSGTELKDHEGLIG